VYEFELERKQDLDEIVTERSGCEFEEGLIQEVEKPESQILGERHW
jgi:hypothetical protein